MLKLREIELPQNKLNMTDHPEKNGKPYREGHDMTVSLIIGDTGGEDGK